ncbi:MAG: hypothetical protein V3U72_00640, partial [Candidatus Aenigmarchaeota archaeon]
MRGVFRVFSSIVIFILVFSVLPESVLSMEQECGMASCSGGGDQCNCCGDEEGNEVGPFWCTGFECEFSTCIGDPNCVCSTQCDADCERDEDCTSGACSGACPGCTYIPEVCDDMDCTCWLGGSPLDPDLLQTYCETECGETWLINGMGGNSKCCGDDSGENWHTGQSNQGCCCNAAQIGTTTDDLCSGYYWCIDGAYCSTGTVKDNSLTAGGTTYALSGDDLICGCGSQGDKCDNDDDGTAEGLCATATCDVNMVARTSDSGTTYYSGCSSGRVCDSDVTPSVHAPRYVRDGYCAQTTCATSLIAADNDGTECGGGTSGCTAHSFTNGDEVNNCNTNNEGTVCSTTVTSGDPPTANGVCVENACDTGTVRVNCGTDGCATGDLTDANMFGTCTTTSGDACDNDVTSIGFTQDGICASGASNSCETSNFVCLQGGTYYAYASRGSCSEGAQCDESLTGGDFSAGAKRYDPDDTVCDNCASYVGEDSDCEQACGASSSCDELDPDGWWCDANNKVNAECRGTNGCVYYTTGGDVGQCESTNSYDSDCGA